MTGTLARQNAMRNPKRTAATAAALMIGVALVGFITIFAASTKASINDAVDSDFNGDFVIDSGSFEAGTGGLSHELAAADRRPAGVRRGQRPTGATPPSSTATENMLVSWDTTTFAAMLDVDTDAG